MKRKIESSRWLIIGLVLALGIWLLNLPTSRQAQAITLAEVPGQTGEVQATPVALTTIVTPGVNLSAENLEVTQAVQDLNHSLPLITGKRTFVRFYVRSSSGAHPTTANLIVHRPGFPPPFNLQFLAPINPGGSITVHPSPDRGTLHHAFLFELPSSQTWGAPILTANLNPGQNPTEISMADNSITRAVSFQTVIPANLVLYRIGYPLLVNNTPGAIFWPEQQHLDHLKSWLRRAYPIHQLNVEERSLYYPFGLPTGLPTADQINAVLNNIRMWDMAQGNVFATTRYYGMVSNAGGFMQGKASGMVASGPTGTGSWGWDFDGSFGDWYGGHELGHTYGLKHVLCSGEEPDGGAVDPDFPHPNGNISLLFSGNTAIYGFDSGWQENKAIYSPSTWKDMMTYCNNQWISGYHYQKLFMKFVPPVPREIGTGPIQTEVERQPPNQTDRLLVSGTINSENDEVELEPLFVLPEAGEWKIRVSGDYAIVLRDQTGTELARYPFTPEENHPGPPDPDNPADEDERPTLFIHELVPYKKGTTQVDLEGPQGVLTTIRAGAATPTVIITEPQGGQLPDRDTLVIAWEARDADGDALTFNVQHSADGGKTWTMVAYHITENRVELDRRNLTGGEQGLFRVWASDGIHTASDVSDELITIVNRPPTVAITNPEDGATVTVSETLRLEGSAYDEDRNILTDDQLEWSSTVDGLLGNGATISVAGLSEGEHLITFRADDGAGGVASDTVSVTVQVTATTEPDHIYLPIIIR